MPKTKKRLGKQKNDKILEKGKMAILHRLYIIGQNVIYIYLKCIFFQNLKVLS